MKPSYRFSLRALFLLTTMAALGVGFLADRARRQRRFDAALGPSDSPYRCAIYDFELAYIESGGLPPSPPTERWPEWLVRIVGVEYFQRIAGLDFSMLQGPVTDEIVDAACALPALRHVRFGTDRLTPEQTRRVRAAHPSAEVLDDVAIDEVR